MRLFSLAARSLSGWSASLRRVPEGAARRMGKALIWQVLSSIFRGPINFSPCPQGGGHGRDHRCVGRKLLPWYTSSALVESVALRHRTVNREVRGSAARRFAKHWTARYPRAVACQRDDLDELL